MAKAEKSSKKKSGHQKETDEQREKRGSQPYITVKRKVYVSYFIHNMMFLLSTHTVQQQPALNSVSSAYFSLFCATLHQMQCKLHLVQKGLGKSSSQGVDSLKLHFIFKL